MELPHCEGGGEEGGVAVMTGEAGRVPRPLATPHPALTTCTHFTQISSSSLLIPGQELVVTAPALLLAVSTHQPRPPPPPVTPSQADPTQAAGEAVLVPVRVLITVTLNKKWSHVSLMYISFYLRLNADYCVTNLTGLSKQLLEAWGAVTKFILDHIPCVGNTL